MKFDMRSLLGPVTAGLLLVPVLAGCSGETEPVVVEEPMVQETAGQHGAWWCKEHGVPEDECPLCKTSLIAEFKAEGDWCDEHNRPDSQCFVCNPENFEKFAARYEAKYGQRPPAPTE